MPMIPPLRHPWRAGLCIVAVMTTLMALGAAVNSLTADANATTMGAGESQLLHDRYTEELALPEGSVVIVRNMNGRVSVTGWDEDYVLVAIDKRLERLDGAGRWLKGRLGGSADATPQQVDFFSAMRVDFRTRDDAIEIVGPWYDHSPDVSVVTHIDVRIPRGADVSVQTENGLVAVMDVEGAVAATSSNGKISCRDLAGATELSTRNGDIACSGIDGALTARATNGSILVDGRSLTTAHALSCTTGNGAIKVRFPHRSSFDLSARTENGYVKSSLAVDGAVPSGAVRSVSGTIGQGGATVTLTTTNGSIHLDEY